MILRSPPARPGPLPANPLVKTRLYSAPARAGILGNPTDIYGGSVISCALAARAYASFAPASVLRVRIEDKQAVFRSAADLRLRGDALDIARAPIAFLHAWGRRDPRAACWFLPADASVPTDFEHWGFSLSAWTEIPRQAGLAGSTAMLAAIVRGLLAHLGLSLQRPPLAELVRLIEARFLGVTCGFQDAYMAVFGGFRFLDFRHKEQLRQTAEEPLATVEELPAEMAPPLVVAHSGVARNSGEVHGGLRDRWERGEPEVIDAYRRITHLAWLGKKALLRGDWPELGAMMNRNHALQRALGGSGDSNERLISAARNSGAWGAKLAGAGQGGTIIALHPDPVELAGIFLDAGAPAVMFPEAGPGLQEELLPVAVVSPASFDSMPRRRRETVLAQEVTGAVAPYMRPGPRPKPEVRRLKPAGWNP
jgi:mevalonate kinase